MKSSIVLLAIFLLTGFTMASDLLASDEPSSKYKITTRKRDDRVVAQAFKNKLMFVVNSPSGISQAVIERLQEEWPRVVVLRLHLKGLESFRASNGKVALDAAVSSQEKPPKTRVWKDGKEGEPLNEKHPYWMDVRIVGGDGEAAKEIPVKDGFFDITLPRAFFEDNPKTITLNWIDFYRR